MEVARKTRKFLGKSLCIGVKMNPADQQNEVGFEEMMEQIALLAAKDIGFLELSGGNYEDPQATHPSQEYYGSNS